MDFRKILIPLLVIGYWLLVISPVSAATNISSAPNEHFAWNDIIGWLDFYSTGNVKVVYNQLSGYADSPLGYIALDCATSPNGDICGNSNFRVTNDGGGNLSGYAWNDAIGWISFDCHNSGGNCASSNYQVKINSTGRFTGYAWNDIIGWISFNCSDLSICDTSDYKVKTSWTASAATAELLSSIIDTGVTDGAAFNNLMWEGNQPSGTNVKFQFASSNNTDNFPDPIGPDGTTSTYYTTAGPDVPTALSRVYHNNHRYFRYKIILQTDASQIVSPRVDDVIVNWSP